jgi:hypothetical protein
LCTIRGALSEFGAVCLQGLWNGHLDLRGRTSKHPYQLKYQRWRLISTPECIHCLAPPGVFKRYDIITTTAQDRPPCSADSTSAGSLSSAGFSWQGSEIRDWTPHRPSEWSSLWSSGSPVLHCAGGDTPCKAERQRSATAIGGKSVATGDCHGRRSHHRRRHRGVPTLQTAPYLLEPPTNPLCSRTLSSAAIARMVSDAQGLRRS